MEFSDWILALQFMPRLLAGVAIILGTLLIGRLIRKAALSLPPSLGRQRSLFFLKIFNWSLWSVAVLLVIQQLGIQLEFLNKIILIIFAIILSALGLTFSLSTFRSVQDVIQLHFYKKEIPLGSYIEVDGKEGKAVDWTAFSLQIETKEGKTSIPVNQLVRSGYTLLRKEPEHD